MGKWTFFKKKFSEDVCSDQKNVACAEDEGKRPSLDSWGPALVGCGMNLWLCKVVVWVPHICAPLAVFNSLCKPLPLAGLMYG